MTTAEITAIFKLSGEARLAEFIKAVNANKSVYGISDDEGWALLGDNDDTDILPLFQHAQLAEAFRKAAGFEEYEVEEIELDELLDWLDEMEEDNMIVAVCPNTRFEGPVLEPAALKAKLLGQ